MLRLSPMACHRIKAKSGAVVRESFEVPPRSVAAGVPAKVMKELDGSSAEWLDMAYEEYTELSERYKKGARIISE